MGVRVRGWRAVVEAIVWVGGILLPNGAMAQSLFVTPSFTFAEVYDDNIFRTSSGEKEDFISRFSPAVETGYRTPRLTLLGRYTFDAEVFNEHPELNDAQARQRGEVDLEYRATRSLTLAANGTYTETQTPGELNLVSGLEAGRVRAERITAGPSLNYRFDPLTIGTAAYEFTRDEISGGIETDSHTGRLGLEREITRRDTALLGYAVRRYLFDGEDTTFYVMTAGWSHRLTRRTSFTLQGGPRVSDDSVDPEVEAVIRHALDRGELSFTYARTETVVIGEAGTVTVESFEAGASYRLLEDALEVRAAPAYINASRGASEADIYRAFFQATYKITEYLSLIGSYQFYLQQGILDGSSDEEITQNVVLLGVTVATHFGAGPRPQVRGRSSERPRGRLLERP